MGTLTLNVFDKEVTRRSSNAKGRAVRLGQSSEITEKELKGRDFTLQAGYANPGC